MTGPFSTTFSTPILQRGVQPYAQIGFMPRDLSIHPEPYQHHWKPGDHLRRYFHRLGLSAEGLRQVGELVYQWVRHCVEKYGRAEVESWYWEVWNEPNIGYWKGTPEEFLQAPRLRRRRRPTRAAHRARRRRGHRRQRRPVLRAISSNTACAAPTYATGKIGTPHRFRLLPRERRAVLSPTATSAWALPTSFAPSKTASASSPRFLN